MNTLQNVAALKETPEFQEAVQAAVRGDIEPQTGTLTDLGTMLMQQQATALASQEVAKAADYLRPRLAWREEADQLREREAAWNLAKAATEAKRDELTAITEAYTTEITTLAEREQAACRAMGVSYNALTELRNGYRGPLVAALAAEQTQQQQLNGSISDANGSLNRVRNYLSMPLVMSLKADEKKRLEGQRREIERQIAGIEAEIAASRQRCGDIEKAMMQP